MATELQELKWLILLLYPIVVLYFSARVIISTRRLKRAKVSVLGLTVEVALGGSDNSCTQEVSNGN